jgi:uncharacterized protein
MVFIGREKELKELSERYNSNKGEFIIIYGRRRLGKTSLIKHSLPKNSIYFLLTQEKSLINLESFKQTMGNLNPLFSKINANSWEEYFRLIDLPENLVIAIDEFPYLVSQDNSILSQFQKIYDEYLKPKKIKLILCGSSMSIMNKLQDYKSPLYGRRTYSIKLEPFNLNETSKLLKYSKINSLKAHMVLGGVPYYLEQFIDIDENLFFEKLISDKGIFVDEPQFLLREEFKETGNYFAILKAISQGKITFSEISDATLIEKGSLSKYLQNLEQLNYIENYKSFFSKQNSKKTRYILKDNFLIFWFKVIYKNLLKQNYDINQVLGKLFEIEVRRIYSKNFSEVGTYFDKDIEIDILAKKDNEILCIECKLSKNKSNLLKLKEKIKFLPEKFIYKPIVITLDDVDLLFKMSKK